MSLFGWWSGSSEASSTPSSENTEREEDSKQQDEVKEEEKGASWNETLSSTSEALTQGFGSFLNKARDLASTVTNTVQDVNIFNEFAEEEEKFKRRQRRDKDAAVPPWVGYNEEEDMKRQILELSGDQRNFLRPPPSGVKFYFNFDSSFPVAMAILEEDKRVKEMRFKLVPKKISEVDFWRNYFYRISLIKQALQIASGNKDPEFPEKGGSYEGEKKEGSEDKEPVSSTAWLGGSPGTSEQLGQQATTEFASDETVDASQMVRETFKQELKDLGVSQETDASSKGVKEEVQEWESSLQEELDQLDLGEVDGADDIAVEGWEKELDELLQEDTEQS